jgi:hypothetical protein
MQKLVGYGNAVNRKSADFAAIATRIPLEFNATNRKITEAEQIQVEKHLRVCIAVRPGFTGAVTVSASEPLLAEAARRVMIKEDYNPPQALLDALSTSGMDKGDRGELIAMLLLILGYDQARDKLDTQDDPRPAIPLLDFLEGLLNSNTMGDVRNALPTHARDEHISTLGEAFKDSKVYFNHFIRVHDYKVINQRFLAAFMMRDAAFLCAINQEGIDIGVPFTYKTEKLEQANMGVILIQVKNTEKHSTSPHRHLFDKMDPIRIGIFDSKHEATVPVIRMVFALGARQGCVTPLALAVRRSSRKRKPEGTNEDAAAETLEEESTDEEEEEEDMTDDEAASAQRPTGNSSSSTQIYTSSVPLQRSNYTAYDLWCGRACQQTFAPIKEAHEVFYNDLLLLSHRINDAFHLPKEPTQVEVKTVEIRRTMYPAATADRRHWLWAGSRVPLLKEKTPRRQGKKGRKGKKVGKGRVDTDMVID